MTTVHTLASGSSGNALLLCSDTTRILLDTGISCRRITAALRELDLTPEALDAILITHTHTDHIAGLQTLTKRTALPILATDRHLPGAGVPDRRHSGRAPSPSRLSPHGAGRMHRHRHSHRP